MSSQSVPYETDFKALFNNQTENKGLADPESRGGVCLAPGCALIYRTCSSVLLRHLTMLGS